MNKVSTKAILKWSILSSSSIPEPVKKRFVEQYQNRINSEGDLVLSSDTHRSQSRNVEACLEKLHKMILAIAEPPAERKTTQPSRASVQKRLNGKKHRSEKKKRRQPVSEND